MRCAVRSLAVALAVGSVLGSSGLADATTPGRNGSIAFLTIGRGGGISTMSPQGEGRRGLTSFHFPALPDWSPDGRRIAYCSLRFGTADLFTIRRDGEGSHRVTDRRGYECDPAWSPDGHWLAFTKRVEGQNGIFRIRPDGSGVHRINPHGYHPQWSPDGRFIAFCRHSRRQAVYVMRSDGSGVHRVTPNRLEACDPDWGPNGERLVVSSFWLEPGTSNVYTVRPDGSGLKQLTHLSADNGALDATWSPNGRRIVFSSDREVADRYDLYVIRAGGGHRRRISETPFRDERVPDWGPRVG
jgi:TolB protein